MYWGIFSPRVHVKIFQVFGKRLSFTCTSSFDYHPPQYPAANTLLNLYCKSYEEVPKFRGTHLSKFVSKLANRFWLPFLIAHAKIRPRPEEKSFNVLMKFKHLLITSLRKFWLFYINLNDWIAAHCFLHILMKNFTIVL